MCDTKFLLEARRFAGCFVDASEERHLRSWHGKAAVDRQGVSGRISEGRTNMAQRVSQKGKRQALPPRQRTGRAAPGDPKRNGEARLAAEEERDQLKSQLAEAQAMIAKLEQARDEAVSRIDWTIDSLHNVLESDA